MYVMKALLTSAIDISGQPYMLAAVPAVKEPLIPPAEKAGVSL